MQLTRIAAILGLLTLGACGLYWTHDGTERQKSTAPDAGHGGGDCGGGGGPYPDAGVLGDGGSWSNDGGGYLPDGGWTYDGGGYLPDAWVDPAPDAGP
ncbi:MAG: hypothetical protein JO257_35940 [Deltaproteobacteria bacterium]|nr:hypothetical protein [Deltaproteobacteria bacterium]